MASISTANAIITITIPLLFPAPVQIQGFGTDEAFDFPSIKSVEAVIGVDGKKSSGFVFVLVETGITLQADSASNDFFETWWTQNQASRDDYTANGVIILPAIGKKFTGTNGSLTDYKTGPDGKKLLGMRKHGITWESLIPAPI